MAHRISAVVRQLGGKPIVDGRNKRRVAGGIADPARLYDTQICIGFNGKTIAEWVINQRKVGSALRQINFYTDHWASDWLINETPIPGVENYLISPSSYQVEHSEADDEFLYNGLPNPAWEIILSAIDDIIDRYRNK